MPHRDRGGRQTPVGLGSRLSGVHVAYYMGYNCLFLRFCWDVEMSAVCRSVGCYVCVDAFPYPVGGHRVPRRSPCTFGWGGFTDGRLVGHRPRSLCTAVREGYHRSPVSCRRGSRALILSWVSRKGRKRALGIAHQTHLVSVGSLQGPRGWTPVNRARREGGKSCASAGTYDGLQPEEVSFKRAVGSFRSRQTSRSFVFCLFLSTRS